MKYLKNHPELHRFFWKNKQIEYFFCLLKNNLTTDIIIPSLILPCGEEEQSFTWGHVLKLRLVWGVFNILCEGFKLSL